MLLIRSPLALGDTLTFVSDTGWYRHLGTFETLTRDVDPWDLNITWYDGLDNQIITGVADDPTTEFHNEATQDVVVIMI